MAQVRNKFNYFSPQNPEVGGGPTQPNGSTVHDNQMIIKGHSPSDSLSHHLGSMCSSTCPARLLTVSLFQPS